MPRRTPRRNGRSGGSSGAVADLKKSAAAETYFHWVKSLMLLCAAPGSDTMPTFVHDH